MEMALLQLQEWQEEEASQLNKIDIGLTISLKRAHWDTALFGPFIQQHSSVSQGHRQVKGGLPPGLCAKVSFYTGEVDRNRRLLQFSI